jgi:2-succinyl-6-hydroxy-2,4-cyclohexadiene-1-carboxylate synthase
LDRFSTIAIDLPGHGRSSAPSDPARYALPRFADDLAAVLDALHVDRAAVLGYSLGARAALHFALAHPARVSALILESASPGIDDPAERAARVASDAALADAIERDGVRAFVDRWEQLPLWASQAGLSTDARGRLRAQRLASDPHGLANSLRGAGAGAEPSVVDRLAALEMPTMFIAGALDPKYVALGRRLASAIPGARLEIVADAGHNVHLERPAAFAELVIGFLDEVARPTG